MCWSKNSSLLSFIIGISACVYLYIRNLKGDRMYSIFFTFVLFMQFLEFLIWSDQPQKIGDNLCKTAPYKGELNNAASQVASFQNLLQPVFGGIVALYFTNGKNEEFFPRSVLKFLIVSYLIGIVFWVLLKRVYSKKLCTIPASGGHHLQWPWITKKVAGNCIWVGYFLTLGVVLLSIVKIPGGKTMALYLLISMLISMSVYPFRKAAGSWWCVSAVGAPLLKVLFPNAP